MNPRVAQPSYPLGLVLFGLFIAVFKAVSLVSELGADGYAIWALIGQDAFFLAALLLIALLQSLARQKWLRTVFWLVAFSMTLFYLLDSLVLLALDEHASLFEIGRYAPEWRVVLGFFDMASYLLILLLLFSMFICPRSSPALQKTGLAVLVAALLSVGFTAISAPRPLQSYAVLSTHGFLEGIGAQPPVTGYSTDEMEFYAGLERETVIIPASKPDIILVIIESLSSINSARTSAAPGMLEGFDKLAEEGVLFQNFFANHQASEGGLIALLGGYPPMHYPTATPYMFDEFAIQAAVIDEYRQRGYFTEFLTNADLAFIGLNRFLDGLGLDRRRGRDDVDALRKAPRVVQDAPSDAYLYREALLSVRHLMSSEQPFLLTLATTSTHLPYTHPEGGPDTAEAVWDWSMQQLAEFYWQLSDTGFLDHGILLITGDHRQMRPLNDAENGLYGDSARARVPLLVLGNGYPRGLLDKRFFQQSDLLRMLGKTRQPETPLSPHPIWVERYNRKYGHIELINRLSVFDEADQGRHAYQLKVPGNRIEWLDATPEFARRVETRIHTQRSQHQQRRGKLNPAPAEEP